MHPWEDYRISYSTRSDLGGGVILTLCHPLDYLQWLIGKVDAVWAFAGHFNDYELAVEDTAEIGLRFTNRVIGSVHLDYNRRPASHCLEIVGTTGALRWDNQDGITRLYRAQTSTWEAQPAPMNIHNRALFERNEMYLSEMQHFLDVLRGEKEPVCNLESGYRTLKVALAALESARKEQIITL